MFYFRTGNDDSIPMSASRHRPTDCTGSSYLGYRVVKQVFWFVSFLLEPAS